ncbi:MAG: hemerythrin domain-containing protein [Pseudomonadota bacterium]
MQTTPTQRADTDAKSSAIALLIEDHDSVNRLFQQFENLKQEINADTDKQQIVRQICQELTLHTQAEEEVFYPAVRAAIAEQELMDDAEMEHMRAKQLIAQLENMSPTDEYYDARVSILKEYVNHHVREEQDQMFPRARKVNLDLQALGEQILSFKKAWEKDSNTRNPRTG